MTKDEMKNRISMALKDPVLQQGFEIICKNLSDLEKENAEAKEIINEFFRITQCVDGYEHEHMELVERADAFLKE